MFNWLESCQESCHEVKNSENIIKNDDQNNSESISSSLLWSCHGHLAAIGCGDSSSSSSISKSETDVLSGRIISWLNINVRLFMNHLRHLGGPSPDYVFIILIGPPMNHFMHSEEGVSSCPVLVLQLFYCVGLL